MRLDQALVARGLCESRTEAQGLIQQGHVLVGGEVCTKQVRQIMDTDEIILTGRKKYVSRGGEKLEGILTDVFGSSENAASHLEGKSALDVGSSTGGFTDCLLRHGIRHVDAVDVGTAQLHESLRRNARVSLFENTDIRTFTSDTSYDVIVADLSFIPLEHVLEKICSLGAAGSHYFLLIKPQFEVGKGNTKKGIVKDPILVQETLEKYERLAQEKGLANVVLFPSHLEGGDGNQEYFLHGKHQ